MGGGILGSGGNFRSGGHSGGRRSQAEGLWRLSLAPRSLLFLSIFHLPSTDQPPSFNASSPQCFALQRSQKHGTTSPWTESYETRAETIPFFKIVFQLLVTMKEKVTNIVTLFYWNIFSDIMLGPTVRAGPYARAGIKHWRQIPPILEETVML